MQLIIILMLWVMKAPTWLAVIGTIASVLDIGYRVLKWWVYN